MMDETGNAILCEDENGKWWRTSDEGARDLVDLEIGQRIILNPTSFPIGTKIQIYEPELES